MSKALAKLLQDFDDGEFGSGRAAEHRLCAHLLAHETRAMHYLQRRARSSTVIGLA